MPLISRLLVRVVRIRARCLILSYSPVIFYQLLGVVDPVYPKG